MYVYVVSLLCLFSVGTAIAVKISPDCLSIYSSSTTGFEPSPQLIDQFISNFQVLSSVINTANDTIASVLNVQSNIKKSTDLIIANNNFEIQNKISAIKNDISLNRARRSTQNPVLTGCLKEENALTVLSQAISIEISKCITVGLQENTNLITSTIAEAQTFMVLPQIIAREVQTCGLSRECLLRISTKAIQESIETPSKIMVLAARIQQLAYHSLATIDGCALNGLVEVTRQGVALWEDIRECVEKNCLGEAAPPSDKLSK